MKKLLLPLAMLFFIAISLSIKKLIEENEILKKNINLQAYHLINMQNEINKKDSMIIDLYIPVVRLQLACGIMNPDTTFTYIEKVLNPCNIHKLLKTDLRPCR